jgi:hypothetical protein
LLDAVGHHVDDVFFAHDGPENKPQIIDDLVGTDLAGDVAGVLGGELDL